jgi:nucleoid-associated protein YgaU
LHIGIELMNIMNTSNPFQIPVCLQRADSQQRRRERFKRGFIAVVAALVVLLVGLLIEGCMSEQTTSTAPSPKVTDLSAPRLNQPLVVAQKPDPSSQPNLNATRPPAASISNDENAAASSHSRTFYVVKSGDTLTRIAKTHGTTVKALKAANSLDNDHIVAGARLKIPEA